MIPEAFRPAPVALLAAAGDGVRHAILRELAAGPALAVKEITRRLGRRRDLISKHLRILLDAHAVMVRKSDPADGRKQLYEVPGPFRAAPGVLDYGCVVLRFP